MNRNLVYPPREGLIRQSLPQLLPQPNILYRQTDPNVAVRTQTSPAARIIHSPISPSKPASDYLIHLMPQALQASNTPTQFIPLRVNNSINKQFCIGEPQRQFLETNIN
jgi:hypothetical protein